MSALLPIAGISLAVAVTAGAALAMQIRSDIGNAAVFEERETRLVELNRNNAELAERNAVAKGKADAGAREAEGRYRSGLRDLEAAQERAERAETAAQVAESRAAVAESALAVASEKDPPEPCRCDWSSPLPPLRE